MHNPESAYHAAIKTKERINKLEQEILEQKNIYASQIQEYRIAYVSQVLEYIRSEYRCGRLCNLETLLCHCQNKLYGNIDGVELDLQIHRGNPFKTELEKAKYEKPQEGE